MNNSFNNFKKEKNRSYKKKSCLEVATGKLSTRLMTVLELKEYLKKREYDSEEIREVIEKFLEVDYLDDREYSRRFIEIAFEKNKGKRRIFSELAQKGVDSFIIEDVYAEVSEEMNVSEYDKARLEAEKMLRIEELTFEDKIPDKLKGRIGRKLNSYGYSPGIIYQILGEMRPLY